MNAQKQSPVLGEPSCSPLINARKQSPVLGEPSCSRVWHRRMLPSNQINTCFCYLWYFAWCERDLLLLYLQHSWPIYTSIWTPRRCYKLTTWSIFLFKMIFLHIVYGYVSIFKYIKVNLFICNLIRKGKLHLINSRILYTLLIMRNLFSCLYYTRFPFFFVNCLSKYNPKKPNLSASSPLLTSMTSCMDKHLSFLTLCVCDYPIKQIIARDNKCSWHVFRKYLLIVTIHIGIDLSRSLLHVFVWSNEKKGPISVSNSLSF